MMFQEMLWVPSSLVMSHSITEQQKHQQEIHLTHRAKTLKPKTNIHSKVKVSKSSDATFATSSSSSLGDTALREPWPPVLFASTGLYPELSSSILQSPYLQHTDI
jgi:hypothetical protein